VDDGFVMANHAIIKRILADIKCNMHDTFDIMLLTHKTADFAKALKRYSQGNYSTPELPNYPF
jgi:hypothetical protein